jgi:hypothetical protein
MTDLETPLPDLLNKEIQDLKVDNTRLYLKLLAMATLLGEAMNHVSDDDVAMHTCTAAAMMDLAATCPDVKVLKTKTGYNIEVRPDEAA